MTLDTGEERDYRALLVANGHHWDPRWPEPAFPGADAFEGVQMHSHHYTGDDPELFAGKRVVVLGMGNSAMDIAVEATQTAERVFLAARRGAWIVPKYVFGRPLDQFVTAPRIPLRGPPALHADDAARRRRRHGALRPAEARPPPARGASDDLGHDPHAADPRRHHAASRTSRG